MIKSAPTLTLVLICYIRDFQECICWYFNHYKHWEPISFFKKQSAALSQSMFIFFIKIEKKKKKIEKFIILKHSISKLGPLWKSGISVIMQWTRPKSNIHKTFIWFAWRHMNVLCTFCFRQCFIYLWQYFIYILCSGKGLPLERLEADDQRCYVK